MRSSVSLHVEVVGQRGVEHLGAGVVALAEVVGPAHRLDELGGDGLAVGVAGEGGEDVGVPGPLLEHLARRLDEVPLGRDAREAHPLGAAGEHVVHEVPELVEERDDLVVLQQAAVEVADEHALGELRAGDAAHEVELGRVLVLAVARVQVEVDAADALARRRTRRRSRPPRATCGRPRAATGDHSSPKSRPVTSSRPWRTDSNGKYVRTRWASTASCSLRTSSA